MAMTMKAYTGNLKGSFSLGKDSSGKVPKSAKGGGAKVPACCDTKASQPKTKK